MLAVISGLGPLGPLVAGAAAQSATPTADAGPARPADQAWLNVRDQELLDLDGDGGFDAFRLQGNWGPGTRPDVVTVYATEGDLPPIADYTQALDFERSVWLFDPQSRGRATIIIRFAREGENVVAYIWDDQDGSGEVAHTIEGRTVTVTESPHWTVKVWTRGDWLRPDGSPTADLHALMDGCGSCESSGNPFPDAVLQTMAIDGRPDYAFDLVDADDDGIPEYRSRRIVAPVSDSVYSLPFFFVQANEGRVRPVLSDRILFWPLLAERPIIDGQENYFDTAPYLPIDWRRGDVFLPTLPGYPTEHGYHVNSLSFVEPEEDPIYVSFESPMAYYDLAEDRDRYPELHIRLGYNGPYDKDLLRGQSPIPQEEVRYSWNQSNAVGPVWEYKVDLAGRHPMTEVTELGPINLAMVPHADLPRWTVDRSWDLATFIAVEGEESYRGSEGIYEWPTSSSAARPYFAGLSPFPPTFDPLPPGLRGEIAERPGPPDLYLDPVDGKLHLLRVDRGSWWLAPGRELRSLNLDGGDRLDGWQLWEQGVLTAQLYRVPGGLLYSDADGTRFRAVDLPDDLGRVLPPTDRASWQALGRLLEENAVAVTNGDLRGLFNRFPGEPVVVASGPLTEARSAAGGFRFAVAGDTATGDALAALTGSQPAAGAQVVTRRADGWSSAPATIALPTIAIRVAPPPALTQAPVHLAVANPGTLDLGPAVVELRAIAADGAETIIGEREVVFDDQGRFDADLTWQPLAAGDWRLAATVRRPALTERGGEPAELGRVEESVAVGPGAVLSTAAASTLGWQGARLQQALVLAGFLLLTLACAGFVLGGRRGAP